MSRCFCISNYCQRYPVIISILVLLASDVHVLGHPLETVEQNIGQDVSETPKEVPTELLTTKPLEQKQETVFQSTKSSPLCGANCLPKTTSKSQHSRRNTKFLDSAIYHDRQYGQILNQRPVSRGPLNIQISDRQVSQSVLSMKFNPPCPKNLPEKFCLHQQDISRPIISPPTQWKGEIKTFSPLKSKDGSESQNQPKPRRNKRSFAVENDFSNGLTKSFVDLTDVNDAENYRDRAILKRNTIGLSGSGIYFNPQNRRVMKKSWLNAWSRLPPYLTRKRPSEILSTAENQDSLPLFVTRSLKNSDESDEFEAKRVTLSHLLRDADIRELLSNLSLLYLEKLDLSKNLDSNDINIYQSKPYDMRKRGQDETVRNENDFVDPQCKDCKRNDGITNSDTFSHKIVHSFRNPYQLFLQNQIDFESAEPNEINDVEPPIEENIYETVNDQDVLQEEINRAVEEKKKMHDIRYHPENYVNDKVISWRVGVSDGYTDDNISKNYDKTNDNRINSDNEAVQNEDNQKESRRLVSRSSLLNMHNPNVGNDQSNNVHRSNLINMQDNDQPTDTDTERSHLINAHQLHANYVRMSNFDRNEFWDDILSALNLKGSKRGFLAPERLPIRKRDLLDDGLTEFCPGLDRQRCIDKYLKTYSLLSYSSSARDKFVGR